MKRAGNYVDGVIKSLKAQKAVDFHRLKEAWFQAVGPLIAGQAEPSKIKGSTLFVVVSSPHWNQEIKLQQRLILKRLGSYLKTPLDKIVCWVGEPHRKSSTGPKQDQSTAEGVPWLDIELPPARRARMEKHLATIRDPETREKVRGLTELAIKRELYLLAKGQLPCPLCAAMRDPELEACPDCEKERQEEGERYVLRLLARKPWLSARDLQDRVAGITKALYLRLRKQLRTNLLQQAWVRSEGSEGAELEKKIDLDYAELLVKITMLSCSLPESSLTPRHFHYALGKRLASAYLNVAKTQSLSTLDNH